MNQLFIHRFFHKTEERQSDVLMAFIASREIDAGSVASELEKEVTARLVPDELIIVVRQSVVKTFTQEFNSSGSFRRLRQRLHEKTPIALISFGKNGRQVSCSSLTKYRSWSNLDLETLLRRGATAVFISNGGFVESTSAYHFRNPSGRHTSKFMRLSNILVRQAEINLIALSVLPHIPENTQSIYIDTPSLFSVVAALNDIRGSEGNLPPIPADSFRSYDNVKSYSHFQPSTSVVLISASSSGNLAGLLLDRGFQRQAIVHVLFLGENDVDIKTAVDLKYDSDKNPEGFSTKREDNRDGDCDLCRQGSIPITLKGDQFDIAGPQPEPLVITRTNAHNPLRELMARHAGTGTFGANAGRPVRQFSVAPEKVASGGKALERLQYLAAARVPGRLGYCIIADEGSKDFANRVLAAVGSEVKVILPEEIEQQVTSFKSEIVQPILVAAAVVGSGRQLLDISRRLRFIPKVPIIYFIGVMTTVSAAKTKTLESSLALTANPGSHAVIILDEINLPAASAPNPWAQELALLDELANNGRQLSRALETRRDRLRLTSRALEDELFLANDPVTPLKLRPGFAFWNEATVTAPHTQADVYYTISAVLQGLRTSDPGVGKKILRTEWFYRTLLSPENFGRFNDAVIQASLLRSGRPSELDYSDNPAASAEAARVVRRIVESATTPRGEAAAEFLMALAIERIRLRRDDLDTIFCALPAQTDIIDELAEICRQRLF
jgi:hypothetical protein